MRVLLKMTMGLTAAGMLIFGSYGVYLMRAERRDLEVAVEREVRMLGRSLRATAEYALRDRRIEDIREVLRALEVLDEAFDVVVFTHGGEAILATDALPLPADVLSATAEQAMNERRSLLRYEPPGDLALMLLAMPLLAPDGSALGGLVLLRPLDDLRRDLVATRRTAMLTVLAFVLASAVLGLILGTAYIGRPLERTVAAIRRVRGGDLTSEVPVESRDEIGDLAAEFNAMVAELRQARTRLEEETESRRRLQRSLQEADKLITIGQLSAGLAHEIGSPLQVLNGRARSLAAQPGASADARRIAAILVEQSDRIARIVEQLLRLARRRPAHITSIDVGAGVRAVLDLLEYEARRRGVELRVRCAPDLPRLRADGDQLQQLVLNLVTNALNATPPGGRVELALEPARLGGSGRPAVRLVVSDSGTGIAAADRPHLFEPFFTTRGTEGGTGLGLTVVKSIVTEHGGTIAVDSEEGQGSRFTIDLPVDGPEVAMAQQEVIG